MPDAHGAELVHELEQRFVTAVETVHLPSMSVDLVQPRNADDLISEADFAADDRLPYWADLWPSSVLLATRLLEEDGRGRSCLELGCGLGLATIAAMRSGFDVLATDYYVDAMRFTRANAWRALGREPAARLVDWRAMPDDLGVFQRVMAADVLYEHRYASLVANAIVRTLAPDGDALISDSGRTATPEFLRECGRVGLQVAGTDVRPYEAGEIRQRITIYTLRKK
jgi:predicted nicotinamide N-methyase